MALGRKPIQIRTLADVRAMEAQGWPSDLPPTTYALIAQAANRFGNRPAISFFLNADQHHKLERYSYRDLLKRVHRTANLFTTLGAARGQAVGLVLPNLPEMHFGLWGAEASAVALPINPLLEPTAIAGLLNAAKAKVVVTLAPFPGTDLYDKVVQAIDTVDSVEHLVLIDLADHVQGWKRLPARFMQARALAKARKPRRGVSLVPYARAERDQVADHLTAGAPTAQDTSSLFGTGGTTGLPKLARRVHANEVANTWMAVQMFGGNLKKGEVAFCGLPLFHVNGALVTGSASFLLGSHVIVGTPQGFRGPGLLDRFWEIVAHHKVVMFSGVPTLFSALLDHPVTAAQIPSLRFAICGAAPLSPELITRFEAVTDVTIMEGYGLTEATCVVSVNPFLGDRKVGSVGLPVPFQEVRIVHDAAEGQSPRLAVTGETGQVLLRGPNIFQGYLDPRHNEGLWVDLHDGGALWMNTGDLGMLDDDGYLWLKGRSKDLIIRGGHNIDPAMIEDAFFQHPTVAQAAAIGRPDEHAGEVPVVYVQLVPGEVATADELMAFAEPLIPERAARPKAVILIDEMPLTAVGKVFKPKLRELEGA